MKKETKIKLAVFFAVAFIGFLVFFSLMGLTTSRDNPYGNQSPDSGWVMQKTDISILVNKDRTAKVVEKYRVQLLEDSFAIDRLLPLGQGERYYNVSASIEGKEHIVAVAPYGNCLMVSVEMTARMVGTINYEISYTVIPKTDFGNSTNFYMNVVGQGWTAAQNDVNVTVEFPSAIAVADSVIYTGAWGSTQELSSDKYAIDGKKLSIEGVSLNALEGITVDLMFDKGSFDFYFDYYLLITAVFGLILAVVLILFKMKKAYNPEITPIVNFYPPKDEDGSELSPMDMGYLIDNKCDASDVTAMIYYFASKGYLKIIDENNPNIRLERVCDLPHGIKPYERMIFDTIFAAGPSVLINSLQLTFPNVSRRSSQIVAEKFKPKTFEHKGTPIGFIAFIIIAVVAALYITVANLRVGHYSGYVSILILIIPAIALFGFGSYIFRMYHKFSDKKKRNMMLLYGSTMFVVSMLVALFIGAGVMSYTERAVFVSFVMIAVVVSPFIQKRTNYYTQRLNDILGFRNFIQTTEMDQLKMLLSSNPSYYYDVLPYANVLGVSDIWQNKFKKLQVEPPAYYSSSTNTLFNIIAFNMLFRGSIGTISAFAVKNTIEGIASGIASSGVLGGGRSGGGGGRGGGGRSGGGFGGGGGRRR